MNTCDVQGVVQLMQTRQRRRPGILWEGIVRKGPSTKQLLRSIDPKQIVLIKHENVDEMAATGLIDAKVKCIINAAETMTARYPLSGPKLLLDKGIPILEIRESDFEALRDGEAIRIDDEYIYFSDTRIPYRRFIKDKWKYLNERAVDNVGCQLSDFIDNTLHYAYKEKDFVIHPLRVPKLKTKLSGKHVVVVVRGKGYKADLRAIKDYIEDYSPVMIGVDGGADALIENGYNPHIIVGDMDSISDEALQCGAEILVHAYPDGRAPGAKRVERLGLAAQTIPAPGTSEDIGMLLAYEQKAELIVTLGAHTHMIDFLEKGRKGMASTLLVRMKIGSKLIDAKGVSKLYHRPVKWSSLWVVPAAGLFPLFILGVIHPGFRHFMGVVWTYFKLSVT
jgi:uncharacterized membrane-anchored protein